MEWRRLSPKAKNCGRVSDLLRVIGWPRLRIPEEKEDQWESFTLSKEQLRWICFQTWAKVTAAWTSGLSEPYLMVSKDLDPRQVWSKISQIKLSGHLMKAH